MWVRLKAKMPNFTIIQCYAPTNKVNKEQIEKFLRETTTYCKQHAEKRYKDNYGRP